MPDRPDSVVDDVAHDRFRFEQDGHLAKLDYRTGDGQLILVHTEVPPELGGRGIAGRLVRAAVERAARTGETVLPWCPYAWSWLEKHPDEAARIAIDWVTQPS